MSQIGKTWVTRKGLKIDRIASAWLIRRFIDPEAAFRFVDPVTYVHGEGEIRFDMFEGEFTHRVMPAHSRYMETASVPN